ncbi:MAG: four helix bundle protein [Prosthecobacter sp.]|uniref:four helix bundle protein n=1 Tax=Prosthecobacter sp. TaxID=1965333 RepID=UPI0025F899AF|nr:four helix bundle protein [Prosthecobacter sp.]MCF7785695.1 four helix bundle protein [Prosthecobacter sp.]
MSAQKSSLALADEMEERFLEFAARICALVEALPDTKTGRHISGQLIRCGTSPAPNYAEACAAESRNDFTHKLGIVLKELRETRIWLKLSVKTATMKTSRLNPLIDECTELMNIIGKSIVTAKANSPAKKARRA